MDLAREVPTRRRVLQIGASAAASVGIAVACSSAPPSPTAPRSTATTTASKPVPSATPNSRRERLTIGLPTPTGFFVTDPHARADEIGRFVASFYSDALVNWERGKFTPGLAISWHAIDETTWEFRLRDGVSFSNGASFDAETVVYNVQRIVTGIRAGAATDSHPYWNESVRQRLREVLAPLADRLGTLQDAVAVSQNTVRIITSQPDPILVGRLLELRMVPTDFDRRRLQYQRRTPGTGPYRIEQIAGTDGVTLVANPGSWRGSPKLRSIRIRYAPEVASRLTGLRGGELDLISGVPRTQSDSLKRAGFQVQSVPWTGTLAIFLDTRPGTPFSDKRLRQALNFAVDKEALVRNVFRGEATVAQGQIVTDLTVGFNPSLKPYAFDPETARGILRELGIDHLDEPLRYQSGVPGHQEIAEAVAGYWKTAGLQVMTQAVEPRRPFPRPGEDANSLGPAHVVTVDPGPSPDADLALQYWTGGRDAARWHQPQFDAALDEARHEMEPVRRAELLSSAVEIMREEAPAVFLIQPNEIWAAAKSVVGFDPQPGTLIRAEDLDKL